MPPFGLTPLQASDLAGENRGNAEQAHTVNTVNKRHQ